MNTAVLDAESEDEAGTGKATVSSLKKARSAAAENQRLKEAREREKARELQRAEAAGRRKERAGRRRGEGVHNQVLVVPFMLTLPESEPVEETPKPTSHPKPSVAPSSQPPSPPVSAPPPPPSSSHKKGAGKKQKRLGRNQYTKDRDFPPKGAASPRRGKSQMNHVSSGDEPTLSTSNKAANGVSNSTSNSKNSPNGATEAIAPVKRGRWAHKVTKGSKQATGDSDGSKDKAKENPSVPDLNKKAQAMLEYIGKMQVDLAGERTPPGGSGGLEGGAVQPVTSAATGTKKEFNSLSSREMMYELTREIMAWQKNFGDGAGSVA